MGPNTCRMSELVNDELPCLLTSEHAEHVRDIVDFFYPNLGVPAIDERAARFAATLLAAACDASSRLDYVPRPPAGRPSIFWLVSEAVRVGWRRAKEQRIYEVARVVVARNFRSEYELLRQGIEH